MASDDQHKKQWMWAIGAGIVALMALVVAWWYFMMRTPTGKVSMADAYAAAFGSQIPAGSFDA